MTTMTMMRDNSWLHRLFSILPMSQTIHDCIGSLVFCQWTKNKQLLQLNANKKEFSTGQLEENHAYILNNNTMVQSPMSGKKPSYTESAARKELISECISRKRKAASTASNQANKVGRKDLPNLINKKVLHKWALVDGNEHLIWGQVIKAVGDTADPNCEFEVKYDEENLLRAKLYEDFAKDDLVSIN